MRLSTVPKAALLALGCVALGAAVSFASGEWVWPAVFVGAILTVLVLPIPWAAVPWWMNPGWALILGVVPGVVMASAFSDEYFLSHWDEPKLFTGEHLAMACVLVLIFAIGVAVGSRLAGSRARATELRANPDLIAFLERSARMLFWVTLAGYFVWFGLGLSRGLTLATLTGTLKGSSNAFYSARNDFLAPVAGVTTLTQFGPLVVTLLMLLRRLGSHLPTARFFIPLFLLALVRAVLKGDRLGILELVIPIAIVAIALPRSAPASYRRRSIAALFPVWLPFGLLTFFGAFEYFRTWDHTYRYQFGNSGFASFALDRLAGYYATAPNNSALLLAQDTGHVPFWVTEWFWNLPGVSSIYPPDSLAGPQAFSNALAGQANVEFNNPGGILVPIVDLGRPGAVLFWLVTGVVLGVAYRWFRNRSFAGLLLYPILFIGLLEGGRVLYWCSGRAVPSVVGALVLVSLARRAQQRQHSVSATGEPRLASFKGRITPSEELG